MSDRRSKSLKKEQSKKNQKNKKEWIITIILAVLILAVFAFILWKMARGGKSSADKVVFRVAGEDVCLDEVNLCILQNTVDLGIGESALNTTAEDGTNADSYYKQEILQLIMDYKVEAYIARKQGMKLTDEEKKSVQQDVTKYLGKIDARILNDFSITQERVVEIYQERYLAHKLEDTVTKDVKVEDQKYCTMYMLLFPKIQMGTDGKYLTEEDGETPLMLSEEEIARRKTEADEAYQKLKDGADIEDLAKEYGIESVSGEQSNVEEGFGDDFKQYAASLKEGEFSPVIDLASCYAIVEMVKENDEEVAKQVMERYQSDAEKEALQDKRKEWYKEAGVEEADFVGNTWNQISLHDFAKYVEE